MIEADQQAGLRHARAAGLVLAGCYPQRVQAAPGQVGRAPAAPAQFVMVLSCHDVLLSLVSATR